MFLPKSPERSRRTKLFLTILAFCLLALTLLATPAQAKIGSGSLEDFQRNVLDPSSGYNKESFDAQSFVDLTNSITTGIVGKIDFTSGKTSGGALAIADNIIYFLYSNPPASGITYFADAGKKLGVVTPAYAQGKGFQDLAATGNILNIWRGVRNLAYLLFIVIFVALAFAIMFRARLSPQVVITIQSALPRIVISLLLITFSFAIVGLLLDLSFVSVRLVDAAFATIQGPGLVIGALNVIGNLTVGAVLTAIIVGIVALIGGPAAPLAIAMIGAALGFIILFAVFRLIFMLLLAYMGILLRVIFAPLIILFDTFPGRPVFWGWFGGILAEVSVFVTAYVIWGVGWMLFHSLGPSFNSFVPMPPGLDAIVTLLRGLFFLVIILMIPNFANVVKETIRRSTQFGAPAGAELGVAVIRERLVSTTVGKGETRHWRQAVARGIYQLLGGRQIW